MLRLFFTNLKNSNGSGGPWGPWGQNGGSNNGENSNNKKSSEDNKEKSSKNPFGNNQNNNKKPDYEDIFTKFIKIINQKINDFTNGAKNQENPTKSSIGLVFLGIVLLYLTFGFYKVEPDENAATLYFGKFYKIAGPGLNYHLPFPFGQVIKKSVTNVNTEEFGFSSNKKTRNSDERNFNAESLMLTGDENIVDIQFQVQWQISDIKDYVFNIAEPNQSIRKSAESAMREIIARTPIAQALSDGKMQIEQDVKILLQDVLDSYKSGIRVVLVQL